MASPTVSIIMPLYNKANYVKKALESVKAQTFTDWECIIVDDGSTDNSYIVAKDSISDDTRFSIISQENQGVAAARNNGIAKTRGEFIAFLDADDWWDEHYLQEMMQFAKEYPEAGLYASNYIYFKPGKTHVAVDCKTGYINYPEVYFNNDAMPVWTGATIVRRNSLIKADCFPVGIKLGEDFILWTNLSLSEKFAFLDKALAYYNNDIPSNRRATRNLHAPEYNMLWNLPEIPKETSPYYSRLYSRLRAIGLMDYWLSRKYHDMAEVEVKKIDWNLLPDSLHKPYRKPVAVMRLQSWLYSKASTFKRLRYC